MKHTYIHTHTHTYRYTHICIYTCVFVVVRTRYAKLKHWNTQKYAFRYSSLKNKFAGEILFFYFLLFFLPFFSFSIKNIGQTSRRIIRDFVRDNRSLATSSFALIFIFQTSIACGFQLSITILSDRCQRLLGAPTSGETGKLFR